MILFWLEDRADSIEEFEIVARSKEFRLAIRQTFLEIVNLLGEKKPEPTQVFFVLDVLLAGQTNLASIGIQNVDTGDGTMAGIKFAEKFLLAEGSAYKDCPICFLTELEIDTSTRSKIKDLRPTREIHWIRKYKKESVEQFERFLSRQDPDHGVASENA